MDLQYHNHDKNHFQMLQKIYICQTECSKWAKLCLFEHYFFNNFIQNYLIFIFIKIE